MLSGVSNSGFTANRIIAALGASRVQAGPGAAADETRQGVDEVRATPENEPVGKSELTEEEKAEVEELRTRDAEVRQHEQAHQAAAGQYAIGGPSFQYETGPDGSRYAVEGEVQIDTSEVQGDPEATIRKMQQVQHAASAPSQPSAQDRQVAAKAAAVQQQARADLARERAEESADADAPPEPAARPDQADARPGDPGAEDPRRAPSEAPGGVVEPIAANRDPAAQASRPSDPAAARTDPSDPASSTLRRMPLMPRVAQLNAAVDPRQPNPAGRFIDVVV